MAAWVSAFNRCFTTGSWRAVARADPSSESVSATATTASGDEMSRPAPKNSWYYSGDVGYLDDDGFLYIHDRVKDMIVSGGENIYPAEIESVLFGHDAVADVAVIGVPDDKWGETVKAVVVPKPGVKVDERDIMDFCQGKIAGFKRPRSVDFIDELPRNPTGKILKRVLRKKYWEGRDREVN